ncbi:MAG: YjgP/YjgQ family permease [Flavobacteriaceae bacterium]|nr:YjgP/YjgQ family permease [Flavobacteriaceae bacterium]
MKIIDKYILTSYLKIFFSFFMILMFIFIIQIIWVFIDDLAGKEVDFDIIFKFLLYYSPKLLPLVLPLTVLLASIMTFGNLSENYELAAIKSSGISLFKSMRSLIVFNLLLCLGMFFIANTLIPYAEFKSYNLRKNLAKLKPALAITEGVFNDINTMNIKVAEKFGPDNNLLRDVIIHMNNYNSKNLIVIKAEEGKLINSNSDEILQLVLKNGNRYEEIQSQKPSDKQVKPHTYVSFEKYIMNIDLRDFNQVDFGEEKYNNTYRMQNISQLKYSIDSLSKKLEFRYANFGKSFYTRTGISNFKRNVRMDKKVFDKNLYSNYKTHLSDYPKDIQISIVNSSLNNLSSQKQVLSNQKNTFFIKEKIINLHKSNLFDKYAFALTSIILFFVGAPLGALIRKGGFGLPMVVSLILFLAYNFIGTFTRNAAEDGSIDAMLGSWVPNIIMLPLGIYLIWRASADKAIFNLDNLLNPFKVVFNKIFSRIKA